MEALKSEQDALPGLVRGLALTNKPVQFLPLGIGP